MFVAPAGAPESTMFELDEAFVATSQAVGDLSLSHVRLQDDARYPWIVLIPRREAARELEDLSRQDLATLTNEILAAGRAVRVLGVPVDKLNIGALGNVVSQLHVHVIVRKRDDAAWPAPVWGKHPAKPYTDQQVSAIRARLRELLPVDFVFTQG